MRDRRIFIVPIMALIFFGLGIFAYPYLFVNSASVSSSSAENSIINGYVRIEKIDSMGVRTLLSDNHNNFTQRGQNMTKEYLALPSSSKGAITAIAVGNGTNVNAQDYSATNGLNAEIAECGLSRAAGTFTQNNTAGVWFVERVFTVTSCGGTIRANTTALLNSTGITNTNFTFASANFTNADLASNDQLNVTWVLSVS